MNKQNKYNAVKRIAIVAPADKRKELIEWSYLNKNMLAEHELIATSNTASLLEGTVNKPVYKLDGESAGGFQQMAAMMNDNKVDIIFFFENPMRTFNQEDNSRKLLDLALENNIVIASEGSKVDFM